MLMALSRDSVFISADRTARLEKIAGFCSRSLGISRVSVWKLDKTFKRLDCEVLYTMAGEDFRTQVPSLHEANFPNYFAAIKQQRLINADKARSDERTAEFTHSYLVPENISSMLDVPVFSAGELSGILCLEQLDERQWKIPEMALATSIADLISLINLHDSWQQSQRELEFLHHRDLLTRLENRVTFQRRMENDLRTRDSSDTHALILVGIDGFKVINDAYGYQLANQILITVASRLQTLDVESPLTVARTGGDVFAIWAANIGDIELMKLLMNVQQRLAELIVMPDSTSMHISFTIGVTLLPVPGFSGADPMRCGEYGLVRAKAANRGSVTFFDQEWVAQLNYDHGLDTEISKALLHNQFFPHYQPIVSASTGEVVGIEALARWQKSADEVRAPNMFLPKLAELGLIPALGKTILRQACVDLKTMIDLGLPVRWVAVNIAGEHLSQPDFIEQVVSILSDTGLEHHNIRLEIVEELIVQDNHVLQQNVRRLKDAGLRMAIDDFGTGYSSLSRLKQLPIGNLKIDRSFVAGLPGGNDDQCISRSILGLAQGLGMSVTAEGIETREQALWLRENGCNFFQGFLISRPLALKPLMEWMARLDNRFSLDMAF